VNRLRPAWSSVDVVSKGRLRTLLFVGCSLVAALSVVYALAGGLTSAAVLTGTLVVSASFIVAGGIATYRRPTNRTGPLMVATGLSLLVGLVQGPPAPLLSPLGVLGGTVSGVLLGYLILGFPKGELRASSDRVFIVLTAASLAATNLARLAAFDPASAGLGYENPYLLVRDPALVALTIGVERSVTVALMQGLYPRAPKSSYSPFRSSRGRRFRSASSWACCGPAWLEPQWPTSSSSSANRPPRRD
jgi:hypothetical protein